MEPFFGIALRLRGIGENEAKINEKGAEKVKDDKLKKGCYGHMGWFSRLAVQHCRPRLY